jgi:hypothetical protein
VVDKVREPACPDRSDASDSAHKVDWIQTRWLLVHQEDIELAELTAEEILAKGPGPKSQSMGKSMPLPPIEQDPKVVPTIRNKHLVMCARLQITFYGVA